MTVSEAARGKGVGRALVHIFQATGFRKVAKGARMPILRKRRR